MDGVVPVLYGNKLSKHKTAMANRKQEDLINLSRWETINFYHLTIDQNIAAFLPTRIWKWISSYLSSRFGRKADFQFYPSNGDSGVYQLIENDGKVTITIASDWANDTFESALVGKLMRDDEPDYSIHLGDVYYVGDPSEVEANFGVKGNDQDQGDWAYGSKGFLALPGNHEFFSKGIGFYDNLLSKTFINDISVKQKAGFFCLENEHWRIIGLDTGYTSVGIPIWEFGFPAKCELNQLQLDWLKNEVNLGNPNDHRGIIILSHHQYYSAFENGKCYERPAEQLAVIMGENKSKIPVIWYWGHQHILAIYDNNKIGNGIQAYGRCIGHGGMPVVVPEINNNDAKKSHLLFYDLSYKFKIDDTFIGNNGYVKMILEGDTMIAKHIQLEVENIIAIPHEVMEEKWTINLENGALSHELTDESLTILYKFKPLS